MEFERRTERSEDVEVGVEIEEVVWRIEDEERDRHRTGPERGSMGEQD